MAGSLRCKVSGCDRDPCGVCRRCGDSAEAQHAWAPASSDKPCFERTVCERCGAEHEKPNHDWEPAGEVGGQTQLRCSRCGLTI